jgi:hypothetical protein
MFFMPQLISFCGLYVGWLNSCFCWSAAFSLHERAYLVFKPTVEIMKAVKLEWPILTGVVLGLHVVFIVSLRWYYAAVVHLFKFRDGYEEKWAEEFGQFSTGMA